MSTKPVFIISLPRSGSTLLQRILSTHEDISTKSELWFLLPHVEAIKNKYTFSRYSNISLRNATKALLEQLPEGENDYYQAIRRLSDHLYSKLAKNHEKYLLDKTPRYYFIIDEISKIYPDAKFIFVFRNPLAIAASVIESFNKNHLGDYRHKVDLYLGPRMLADGYMKLKDRSVAISYENLVRNPETTMREICDYLEIPFHRDLLNKFADVPVGELGDQYGSKKFTTIMPERTENWKRVFSTTYRRKFLRNYLHEIGRYPVETCGYDYDDLTKQINEYNVSFSLGIRDRFDLFICAIMSYFEGVVFIDRIIKRRKEKGRCFLLH
jgi:hypothetical protein